MNYSIDNPAATLAQQTQNEIYALTRPQHTQAPEVHAPAYQQQSPVPTSTIDKTLLSQLSAPLQDTQSLQLFEGCNRATQDSLVGLLEQISNLKSLCEAYVAHPGADTQQAIMQQQQRIKQLIGGGSVTHFNVFKMPQAGQQEPVGQDFQQQTANLQLLLKKADLPPVSLSTSSLCSFVEDNMASTLVPAGLNSETLLPIMLGVTTASFLDTTAAGNVARMNGYFSQQAQKTLEEVSEILTLMLKKLRLDSQTIRTLLAHYFLAKNDDKAQKQAMKERAIRYCRMIKVKLLLGHGVSHRGLLTLSNGYERPLLNLLRNA